VGYIVDYFPCFLTNPMKVGTSVRPRCNIQLMVIEVNIELLGFMVKGLGLIG
jgi:hypothetical protein